MRRRRRTSAVAAVACLVLWATAHAQHEHAQHGQPGAGSAATPAAPRATAAAPTSPEAGPAAAFANAMNAGMDRMMRDMHAAQTTGDPDVDFLAMMIPHHEGAVEMARLVLVYGRDPATRRLAEDIIASQTVEIEGMRRRLEMLRGAVPDRSPFPALGGTRGPAK